MALLTRMVPWLLMLVAACVPDFDIDESVVSAPRVLAVRADPPDTRPGDFVNYTALVASPEGTIASASIDWAFCIALKPLAELGPVSPACVQGDDGALSFMGAGSSAGGVIPLDACSKFGPEPPPTPDGQGGRPTDPDATGGYSQPVRAALALDEDQPALAFFGQRINCGLVGANQAESAEFRRRYRLNENPAFDSVEIVRADGSVEFVEEGAVPRLAPGEEIELVVHWPDCPSEAVCGDGVCLPDESPDECPEDCSPQPLTCAGAESYLLFNLDGRTFQLPRESIRISWTANRPGFELARTGVSSDDDASESGNRFVAPLDSGSLTTWIVIRDDRGGVGHRTIEWEIGF